MRKKIKFFFLLIAGGLLIFLVFYGWTISGPISNFIRNTRTTVYSRLSTIGAIFSEIKKIRILVEENSKLKEENLGLMARLAYQAELEDQNNFLRAALGLNIIKERKASDAGVFNVQFTPEGHYLLINKGALDGIKKDDIIVSSSGILIGIIDSIFENYSKVLAIDNSDFKTTIKIISKNISGIAKGGMGNLYIELISQNDDISEGDTVVTGGNDIFPPGLIIGKVTKISSKNGSLFKAVEVRPAMADINLSRVLVLGK